MAWYTWVKFGRFPGPARGPFHTEEEAFDALDRFRKRYGAMAGEYENIGTLRLYKRRTRETARNADISEESDE